MCLKTGEFFFQYITLGQPASGISINLQTNMIYVAGYETGFARSIGSIYVINGTTNKIIEKILLTNVASSNYVGVNPQTNMVYIVSVE